MPSKVGECVAKWGSEIDSIAGLLHCDAKSLKAEMIPVLEKIFLAGADSMLEDVEHVMSSNERPGWWGKAKILLRVKYGL